MANYNIEELLDKYRSGTATEQEVTYLLSIVQRWEEHPELQIDEAEFLAVQAKMLNDLNSEVKVSRSVPIWPRVVAVAAAVAVIVSGVYFFNYHNKGKIQDSGFVAQDVRPGKVGATLTLANGKKIRLADAASGELAVEAGVEITKTADGEILYEAKRTGLDDDRVNTLSTERGETYVLTLPDRSKVWLNAASSLTYRASLNERGRRVVRLSGEAYFEISKDKEHPFVVETEKQQVEVLGTHFNVNAYRDEPAIATTLLEGSVKVTSGLQGAGQFKVLKPGEQALNNGRDIKTAQVNTGNITDWKDGDFYFESVDFRSVMRKIGRWYAVEVVYDASVPNNITSNGVISRNNNLSEVLKLIERSGQVHFKIEGKKVLVSR